MSPSPSQPSTEVAEKPTPVWGAALAGVALGLIILAFVGRSETEGRFDPSTIVDRSRLPQMAQEYPPVEFSTLSGFSYGDAFGSDTTPSGKAYSVPASILALSGRKISVIGYMLPLDADPQGVSQFLLNASFDMCYYGAPTLPNQFIVAKMRGGRRTRYTHTPIAIFGTLSVREERKSGRVVSLYEMEVDRVAM